MTLDVWVRGVELALRESRGTGFGHYQINELAKIYEGVTEEFSEELAVAYTTRTIQQLKMTYGVER